ncbi:cell adhesion molecule 2-like [Stegodyphus dumicola]|uniref:cell adhesion molecule 2-like n=1 Tax=Stegodyphus dumicola TaxID=202533 RepID=UPI0015A9D604|nr:cell adhesion molecule 2-like [Stegodyphus dumicola]
MAWIFLVVVPFLVAVNVSKCLRIVTLDVPSEVSRGQNVEISCIPEMKKGNFTALLWHKDGKLFFKFSPAFSPKVEILHVPGVKVDPWRSGLQSVLLKDVDLKSEGMYSCSVISTEGLVEAKKEMKVIAFPKKAPKITGSRTEYRVGDVLEVNCKSSHSKPAEALQWYINDHELLEGNHPQKLADVFRSPSQKFGTLN